MIDPAFYSMSTTIGASKWIGSEVNPRKFRHFFYKMICQD